MANPQAPDGALGLGRRAEHLARLRGEELDLLVVGGGITGAGIALDAAARGLRVGLVEKGDFAGGTSSRSTKLIHGGLRYLAQLEFGLTREALTERHVLDDLAPGLVEWLPFVLPLYGSLLEAEKISAGLWLYDLLAGGRPPTPHRRLGRAELLGLAPGLRQVGLRGAFVYSDCRTDDVRLTLEVLRTAVARGAAIANYVEAQAYLKAAGRVVGLAAADCRAGKTFEVRARRVVLAGGVWIDRLLQLDDPAALRRIRPAKGVHLLISRDTLGFDVALFLPTAPDGRLVFVVPWHGATLIGTTDTDYAGPLDAPLATRGDVGYLLASVNRAFPNLKLGPDAVVSVQAGLRPLVYEGQGDTTRISRHDRLYETPSGLIAIAGGQLTTYRRMAERVVDLVVRRLRQAGYPAPTAACSTDRIALGAFAPGPVPALRVDEVETLSTSDILRLRYGANAAAISSIAAARPELQQPIVPGLSNVRAEVVYAVRHELAETVADVLARRCHVVQLDREQGRSAAPDVARLMAEDLGWDEARVAAEVARFAEDVRQFTPER